MKGCGPRVCGGCGCGRFMRESVPPLCFATSGCSCVRSSMRVLNLFGEEAGAGKPCVFPCEVAAAGDERYLVCAAGAAAVVSCANRFLLVMAA